MEPWVLVLILFLIIAMGAGIGLVVNTVTAGGQATVTNWTPPAAETPPTLYELQVSQTAAGSRCLTVSGVSIVVGACMNEWTSDLTYYPRRPMCLSPPLQRSEYGLTIGSDCGKITTNSGSLAAQWTNPDTGVQETLVLVQRGDVLTWDYESADVPLSVIKK